MASAISSTARYTALHLDRTAAQGGGKPDEVKQIEIKDHTPQVVSVALLVASAVLGSAIFGVIGALVAPLIGLWFLAVVSNGECFDPDVTKAYKITPKANPKNEIDPIPPGKASHIDMPNEEFDYE